MLNLDTHILLFALSGELKPRERKLLATAPWSISAICLWEITKLAQLGRIPFGLEDAQLATTIDQIHVWPITPAVCHNLRLLDFSSDPADELIAATSLTHGVPLITRDAKIRTSKIVPFAR